MDLLRLVITMALQEVLSLPEIIVHCDMFACVYRLESHPTGIWLMTMLTEVVISSVQRSH